MALVLPLEQKFPTLLLGALPEIEFSQKGNKGRVFIHMPSQFCRSNYLLKWRGAWLFFFSTSLTKCPKAMGSVWYLLWLFCCVAHSKNHVVFELVLSRTKPRWQNMESHLHWVGWWQNTFSCHATFSEGKPSPPECNFGRPSLRISQGKDLYHTFSSLHSIVADSSVVYTWLLFSWNEEVTNPNRN